MSTLIPVVPTFLVDKVFENNWAVLIDVASNTLFDSFSEDSVGRQVGWLPEDFIQKAGEQYPWMKFTPIRSYTIFVTVVDHGNVQLLAEDVGKKDLEPEYRILMPGVAWRHAMTAQEIKATDPVMVDTVSDVRVLNNNIGLNEPRYKDWAGPIALVKTSDAVLVVNAYVRLLEPNAPKFKLHPFSDSVVGRKFSWVDHRAVRDRGVDLLERDLADELKNILCNAMEDFVEEGGGTEG